jgi:hypothetical protein
MDAGTGRDGLAYELLLVPGEPVDRPAPAVPAVSYIDGVATNVLDQVYAEPAGAFGAQHEIELRVGSVTIAIRTIVIAADSCLGHAAAASFYEQSVCAYASGDLRIGGDEATGPDGGCIADYRCAPRCDPTLATGCGANQHCTSIVTSVVPFASHLGCAQVGPKQRGDSCALISDADGVHDDCGLDLLCVTGTCQPTCRPGGATTCSGCAYVPGHAPELGICPSPVEHGRAPMEATGPGSVFLHMRS